jgi:hypothetical protein
VIKRFISERKLEDNDFGHSFVHHVISKDRDCWGDQNSQFLTAVGEILDENFGLWRRVERSLTNHSSESTTEAEAAAKVEAEDADGMG